LTEPQTTSRSPGGTPKLGGLVKHSAIYSAAPLLRQVIAIAMTHLYTRWLGDSGFGVKGVIDLWMVGIQQLLGVNVLGAMVRFYYDSKSNEDRSATITSTMILVTAVAWLVCGTAFLFSSSLQPWMLPESGEVARSQLLTVLQLTLILIPFQLSTQSGFYYLMAVKQSRLFTFIQTAKLLFEIALNFLLLGVFDLGVPGFLMSMLAGEALTSLFLCGWILKELGPRFVPRVLRPLLVYAAPLVPVGVCQLAIHSLDRYLLVDLSGSADGWGLTGVYDLGYKIGFLVTTMILGPFIQIFHPWIYDIEDEEERGQHLARVGTWAVLAIAAASLGVILFGRQAAVVLGGKPEFWEAWRVIPYIAGGYVFWALYHVSQIPLFIAKRTGRLLFINFVALGINIYVNTLLIPEYQIVGAAITTAVTFASLALMGMLASRSTARVPFEFGRLALTLAGIVLGGAFALWIDTLQVERGVLGVAAAMGLKALACAALIGGYWLLVLRADERSQFIGWIRRR